MTDAELVELEKHHLVVASEWLAPRVRDLIAEVRRLRQVERDAEPLNMMRRAFPGQGLNVIRQVEYQRLKAAERLATVAHQAGIAGINRPSMWPELDAATLAWAEAPR